LGSIIAEDSTVMKVIKWWEFWWKRFSES